MEPLLEVESKALGTGVPASLQAYPEQVEVRTVRSPREVEEQTARYDEISKVEIERGMTFAELKVKTRGLLSGEVERPCSLRALVWRTPNAPRRSSMSVWPALVRTLNPSSRGE